MSFLPEAQSLQAAQAHIRTQGNGQELNYAVYFDLQASSGTHPGNAARVAGDKTDAGSDKSEVLETMSVPARLLG